MTDKQAVFEIMTDYTDICVALMAGDMPADFWTTVEQVAKQCDIAIHDVSTVMYAIPAYSENIIVQSAAAAFLPCQTNTSALFH